LQGLTSYFTHGAYYDRNVTQHIFFLAHIRAQIKCIYRTSGPDAQSSAALLTAALRQIRKTFCILSKIYILSLK